MYGASTAKCKQSNFSRNGLKKAHQRIMSRFDRTVKRRPFLRIVNSTAVALIRSPTFSVIILVTEALMTTVRLGRSKTSSVR